MELYLSLHFFFPKQTKSCVIVNLILDSVSIDRDTGQLNGSFHTNCVFR